MYVALANEPYLLRKQLLFCTVELLNDLVSHHVDFVPMVSCYFSVQLDLSKQRELLQVLKQSHAAALGCYTPGEEPDSKDWQWAKSWTEIEARLRIMKRWLSSVRKKGNTHQL